METKPNAKFVITGVIGLTLISILSFIYLNSGNFFRMRNVAYIEFHLWLREAEVDPRLFSGPDVDFTYENTLVFKWCQKDSSSMEPYCVRVYVPPYFGSFNAVVRGSGNLESFRKIMGTKKR